MSRLANPNIMSVQHRAPVRRHFRILWGQVATMVGVSVAVGIVLAVMLDGLGR